MMPDALELWEEVEAENVYMFAGWRQWADAGSVSSGLPEYLIHQTQAHPIGEIQPGGFYLFQIPGTHDLVRPIVKFNEGYPEYLETPQNEFYYSGDQQRGLVFFTGDEPHMDIERYISTLLQAAKKLGVKRIIGFGGVYGEVPFEKERQVSCNYSQAKLKRELKNLAVDLSNYQGGASIGSYLCKRASEQGLEYVGMYAIVPTYDFSDIAEIGSTVRIETDYMAWLGLMRRVNYMLKLDFDLSDLENKSAELLERLKTRIDEIEQSAPQVNVQEYFQRISQEFTETPFDPLDEVWEDELRRLLDKLDDE